MFLRFEANEQTHHFPLLLTYTLYFTLFLSNSLLSLLPLSLPSLIQLMTPLFTKTPHITLHRTAYTASNRFMHHLLYRVCKLETPCMMVSQLGPSQCIQMTQYCMETWTVWPALQKVVVLLLMCIYTQTNMHYFVYIHVYPK